jgi:hypothetical protein
MTVHKKLMKSYKWYRAWHQKPCSGYVHISILMLVFSYNLYLLVEIFKYAQEL